MVGLAAVWAAICCILPTTSMQAVSIRQVVVAIIPAMIEDRETNEWQIQLHTKKMNERSCSILFGFGLGLDQELASAV